MPFTPIMAFGAGICSAVAMFSIVFGTVLALPLFYLAPLPLYLAGFGIGGSGALIAVSASIVTVGLIGGIYVALPFALAYGAPVIMACRLALRTRPAADGTPVWYPVGNVAAAFCALGATFLLVAGLTSIMDEGSGPLQETVAGFLHQALAKMAAEMPNQSRDALVGNIAPFFPGMAAASWMLMHIVNAALGQAVLVKSGRAQRPGVSYADMTLPDWCSWLLVLSGVMALALPGDWSYIGHNLVIVALAPFFLLGLALVHTMARRFNNGGVLLFAFYVLLMVLGWAAFAVAGAGVIEQWVGLRNRVQAANDQESE